MDPQRGITPPQGDGQPLKQMSNGLRWNASQSLSLEAANVAHGLNGFVTPTTYSFYNKGDKKDVPTMA